MPIEYLAGEFEGAETTGPSEAEIAREFDEAMQAHIAQRLARLGEEAALHKEFYKAALAGMGQPLPQNPDGLETLKEINRRMMGLYGMRQVDPRHFPEPQYGIILDQSYIYPKYQTSLFKPPYKRIAFTQSKDAAGAISSIVTPAEIKQGWLGAEISSLPEGGSAYALTMSGEFITARAKCDSIQVTAHFQLSYQYALSVLLGLASIKLTMKTGLFSSGDGIVAQDQVVEDRREAWMGWHQDSKSGVHVIVTALLENIRGGHMYMAFGGVEQWCDCGGQGWASNFAQANLNSIQVVQYRKGGL